MAARAQLVGGCLQAARRGVLVRVVAHRGSRPRRARGRPRPGSRPASWQPKHSAVTRGLEQLAVGEACDSWQALQPPSSSNGAWTPSPSLKARASSWQVKHSPGSVCLSLSTPDQPVAVVALLAAALHAIEVQLVAGELRPGRARGTRRSPSGAPPPPGRRSGRGGPDGADDEHEGVESAAISSACRARTRPSRRRRVRGVRRFVTALPPDHRRRGEGTERLRDLPSAPRPACAGPPCGELPPWGEGGAWGSSGLLGLATQALLLEPVDRLLDAGLGDLTSARSLRRSTQKT